MKLPLTLQYEWKPKIRTAVQIDSKMVPIPFGFWQTIEPGEMLDNTGRLPRKQEKRLWRLMGQKGPCPKNLSDRIALWREDFDKALDEMVARRDAK